MKVGYRINGRILCSVEEQRDLVAKFHIYLRLPWKLIKVVKKVDGMLAFIRFDRGLRSEIVK